MVQELEDKISFDGGESITSNPSYVEKCKGGAINLNIYKTGHYDKCLGCEYQAKCMDSANVAGEQSEI